MDRVFISIGNINIYWYSVLIIIGIIIGYILVKKEAKRQNIDNNFLENLIFYMVIIGIIGARLYYVIFNYQNFDSLLSIFAIYEGGLAIYGGIIAAIIFIYFYSKKYKQNFLQLLDLFAPSLILAQAIGRWGNFFNHEAYGGIVSYEFLTNLHLPNFIIENMYINGNYHQPTFLYESIFCLIGFIIMMVFRYKKNTKIGTLTITYLIYYGIIRFFIEGLRTDSLYFLGFRISQIVSIIFILIGILILVKRRITWKKK